MLAKHKKWLSKSCGIVVSVVICFFGMMYAHHNNAAQSAFSHLDVKKREIVQGIGVGDKSVTGVARIVRTLVDCDEIQSGDIMVAEMTNDEWLGAMKRCAGIITNGGASQSHAALFGKQYGIPVIVGTGNATEKIKNGDIVTLDCSANGVGRVYGATPNDLSCQQLSIAQHNEAVVVLYQQGGGYNPAREHKNTHQQHYYCQHDAQHHHHQDGHGVQNESQKKQYVTQDMFNQHYPQFVQYVLNMQHELNSNRQWWGDRAVLAGARTRWGGYCDDFAVSCIPVSYDFFERNENYIKSILRLIDLDSVNIVLERSNINSKEESYQIMNRLARMAYEEHIKTIPLPAEIQNKKNELIEDPLAYKKIIDQKTVDAKECHIRIATGLFARYCVEKKCAI